MEVTGIMARLLGLDESSLVPLEQGPFGRVLLIAPEVNAAFNKLQAASQRAGFELKACSAYRSFSAQAAIVSAKFEGKRPVLDALEQPLSQLPSDPVERLNAILRFSALPGFSRHHWGTDLDVFAPNALPQGQSLELTYHEYLTGSYFHEFGAFLHENLAQYGFYQPYGADADAMLQKAQAGTLGVNDVGCEPWHISYRPSAERWAKLFDRALALDYVAASALPYAPYVRELMTPERMRALLAL